MCLLSTLSLPSPWWVDEQFPFGLRRRVLMETVLFFFPVSSQSNQSRTRRKSSALAGLFELSPGNRDHPTHPAPSSAHHEISFSAGMPVHMPTYPFPLQAQLQSQFRKWDHWNRDSCIKLPEVSQECCRPVSSAPPGVIPGHPTCFHNFGNTRFRFLLNLHPMPTLNLTAIGASLRCVFTPRSLLPTLHVRGPYTIPSLSVNELSEIGSFCDISWVCTWLG
jgi:hypothetical protein